MCCFRRTYQEPHRPSTTTQRSNTVDVGQNPFAASEQITTAADSHAVRPPGTDRVGCRGSRPELAQLPSELRR